MYTEQYRINCRTRDNIEVNCNLVVRREGMIKVRKVPRIMEIFFEQFFDNANSSKVIP